MALLAFDVYGTLIDPQALEPALRDSFGSRAAAACTLWRRMQLEYSFRRAAMNLYEDFDVCTGQAFEYTCRSFDVNLSDAARKAILARYGELPAYPGVPQALTTIASTGHRLVAFSNGTEKSVRDLLRHAGVLHRFDSVISVDPVRTFKPDPVVYDRLVDVVHEPKSAIWMVSSNPFDVIGAKAFGLHAIWVQRDPKTVYDPWGIEPDAVIPSLDVLPAYIR
jgi:2-haloacid dehalogenase